MTTLEALSADHTVRFDVAWPWRAAGVVAAMAFVIQYVLYQPHGPIFALIATAPLVPVIDYLLRGRSYQWVRFGTAPANEIDGAR